MYCPQCATPHADDTKFCRLCGTELEAVSLALRGKSAKVSKDKIEPTTPEVWEEKRIENVAGLIRGSILLAVSALIGAAMKIFLPLSFEAPWILIWIVFFGWMAVWGGIEIAYGLSGILEAKSRLRLLGTGSDELVVSHERHSLLANSEAAKDTNPFSSSSSAPASITEGTTRQLDSPEK